MVPYVGTICKEAFQMLYGMSLRSLHMYRKRVRNEGIAVKPHGG
ncbi:hypothetical protein PC123_g18593 [Phytophthora cactorum]|nr:hypothetical protein PC120_g18576 [Phytophthora cactorum]KAG4046013.1 hypothetical protein PC123_g18593 [Phytophthora cactorum]